VSVLLAISSLSKIKLLAIAKKSKKSDLKCSLHFHQEEFPYNLKIGSINKDNCNL
jgi:hypothetical protein